jgi:hypothetical protein
MALRVTGLTATFTLITTFAFLCVSDITLRSILVTIFGAGVALSVTWLLVLATVRFMLHYLSWGKTDATRGGASRRLAHRTPRTHPSGALERKP